MKRKMVCILLICSFLISGVGFNVNLVKAVAAETEYDIKAGDMVEYGGKGFLVTYEITALWNYSYNVNVTITNTGKSTIHNWALLYSLDDNKITNIWNGKIANYENGLYLINNNTWNMDIEAQSSIQFGYTASYDNTKAVIPKSFVLTNCEKDVSSKNYEMEYQVTSSGGGQLTANLIVKNVSDERICDWSLTFKYDNEIYNMWCAVLEQKKQGDNEFIYGIRNPGWSQNIESGSEYTLGFQADAENIHAKPNSFEMKCYDNTIDYEADSDGDGVYDVLEVMYGTNAYLSDTDGDGLSDEIEIYKLGYDPTKKDTDDNGILDGDEDEDEDNLSNIYEVKNNLQAWNADSDEDGLNDGDEVNKYGTNPLLEDTDGDTLIDGSDVKLNFNPNKKDSNDNGITDDKEYVRQEISETIDEDINDGAITDVTVKLSVTGDVTENTTINNVYNEDILSSNVEGLVGVPVDISCDGTLSKATISFHYSPENLGDTDEDDLAILWYDEKNDDYVIYDDEAVLDKNNHTISYTTTHFSTYMVVNKKVWYSVWKNEIDYRTPAKKNKYMDVVLTIDASGSMKGTEIKHAKNALKEFVKAKRNKDRCSVVQFTDVAEVLGNFKKSKTKIINDINEIEVGGKTDVDKGLKKAINVYTRDSYNDVGNEKNILLVCDGDVEYNQKIVDQAVKNNIAIYTILIGNKNESTLEKISNKTGGVFCLAENASDLSDSMFQMEKSIIGEINTKDSDGDGIYDVYEEKGMLCSNGKIIKTNKNKKDSDGDGLSDYEEMVGFDFHSVPLMMGTKTIYKKGTDEYIDSICFSIRSNPSLPDSDKDEYNDKVDKKPLHKDVKLIGIKKSEKFVPIATDSKALSYDNTWNYAYISYGGNQEWWKNINNKMSNGGCGVIAAANVIYYHYRKGKNIFFPFTKDAYMKEANSLMGSLISKEGTIAAPIKYVMKIYWKQHGGSYKADMDVNLFSSNKSSKKLLKKIKKALKKKNPIIFSVGGKVKWKESSNGPMMKTSSGSLIKFNKSKEYFNDHYVTITGVIVNEQDNSCKLQVSSWGVKYYIDYDEIYKYVSKHSSSVFCDAIFVTGVR